jgi:hypothetical protein
MYPTTQAMLALRLSHRILIATIKNMGQCPCPRCFTGLMDIQHLGRAGDTERRAETRKPTKALFVAIRKARKSVFKGYKVSGSRVEWLLGGGSRVPTNV